MRRRLRDVAEQIAQCGAADLAIALVDFDEDELFPGLERERDERVLVALETLEA